MAQNKSPFKNNGNPPTHQAIRFFKEKPQNADKPLVIEFGIGSGCDALQYLNQGWRVHGIDAYPEIILQLRHTFSEFPLFTAELGTLQNFTISEKADIVSCMSVFSFNPKSDFPMIWKNAVERLKDGGLFSFDLFGTQHQWYNPTEAFFNQTEVFSLIEQSGLKIHWQQYYDEQTQLVNGHNARFEYWEFVCEKIPSIKPEQSFDRQIDTVIEHQLAQPKFN